MDTPDGISTEQPPVMIAVLLRVEAGPAARQYQTQLFIHSVRQPEIEAAIKMAWDGVLDARRQESQQ